MSAPTSTAEGTSLPTTDQATLNAGSFTSPAGNQGDALDKGVDGLLTKAGHTQSHSTVEKITDGARGLFKKATGKDAPIRDENYA